MVQADQQMSSSGTTDDDLQVPDVELLQFQKQRSTPKVSLSEVNVDGDEQVHLEVENFEGLDGETPHLGMAKAGSDDHIVDTLKRAGSLDISEANQLASSAAEEESKE